LIKVNALICWSREPETAYVKWRCAVQQPAKVPIRRRSQLIRITALALGCVILLAIGAIAIFVVFFDPNSYKPQIVAAVRSATGRDLEIGGRIGLSLSLRPTLEVSDVSFSNPPGFSRPRMASLQRLELRLALIPLLSRRIQIERLVLQQPDILLETNARGQSNWTFAAAGAPAAPSGPGAPRAAPAPAPSPAAPSGTTAEIATPSIALSSLRIEGGTLAVRDPAGQTTTIGLTRVAATAVSPDAPMHLTADATYNETPVGLIADTGPLSALTGGRAPWPLRLTIATAGARLNVDGTMAQPAAGRGLALAVTADIPDLAALTPLAGTSLPPLKTIAARFRLTDSHAGNGIAISDLTLTLPRLDLAGSASFRRGARPMITASLSGKQIDLDAITGTIAGPSSAGFASKTAKPAAPPARSGRIIPDTRLPLDALRQTDADVQLAVDSLVVGGLDYKAVRLHLMAQDGKFTLDPVTATTPGGPVAVKLTMDARPAAPPVTLTLRAPGLALQAVLKALGEPGYADGTLEVRADLRGAGDSPHAIAASLDGAVGAAVAKGEIESAVLGKLMSPLLKNSEISQLASKAGMTALNCFALRLDASRGAGTLRALKLDTATLGLEGSGGMDFGAETLDLHLRPTAGVAGTEVAAPVIVKGTFADPSIQPDVVGLVTGNAGAAARLALGASTGGLALLGGSLIEKELAGDPCAEPLALARLSPPPAAGTQPGSAAPAAGQPQAKPGTNPGDTLKRLFQ
jgi:uncharacterized protein involved in outer membrane biogenesis